MLTGGDRRLRILQIKQDDKSLAMISSKDQNSINGESSFRVNYYNGVSGAVPFTWETRPGTPKHTFSEETALPPLTPPPSYLFNQKSTNSGKKNSKSKIFNSIFPRMSFREERLRTHEGASLSSSSVSSSLSSSFSAPSTPRDLYISRSCRNNGKRRSRSVVNFGLDEDEDKDEMPPAPGSSTSCFGGGGRGYRSSGEGKLRMYRPMKNVKNTLLSFVGGRRVFGLLGVKSIHSTPFQLLNC